MRRNTFGSIELKIGISIKPSGLWFVGHYWSQSGHHTGSGDINIMTRKSRKESELDKILQNSKQVDGISRMPYITVAISSSGN